LQFFVRFPARKQIYNIFPPGGSMLETGFGKPGNETMSLTLILIFACAAALVFIIKKTSQISPKEAVAHLKNGALPIDVRTSDEFSAGHPARAINIPLDEVETAVPKRVKDKNQGLLLHCLAGGRSSIAQSKLKNPGYTNAFNLGSYARAEKYIK
jgi:rhodanese-related sulfurtransferase